MSKPTRDPKAAELDIYRAFLDSEGYKQFHTILTDIQNRLLSLMPTLLVTDKDIAEHNQRVGMLQGIAKASTTIPAIIKELERELAIDHALGGQKQNPHQPY